MEDILDWSWKNVSDDIHINFFVFHVIYDFSVSRVVAVFNMCRGVGCHQSEPGRYQFYDFVYLVGWTLSLFWPRVVGIASTLCNLVSWKIHSLTDTVGTPTLSSIFISPTLTTILVAKSLHSSSTKTTNCTSTCLIAGLADSFSSL